MSQSQSARYSNSLDVHRVRTDGSRASVQDGPKSANSHTAYERYKAALHAIFDGKAPLPEHLKSLQQDSALSAPVLPQTLATPQAAPATPAATKTKRRLSSAPDNTYPIYIEALRRASTPDEIRRAIDSFREANYPLPEDEDLLAKTLTHPNEEAVLDALAKLEGLLAQSATRNPRLLASRLENAALTTPSSQVRKRCQSLRDALR